MDTACKIQPHEPLWSTLLKVAFQLKNDCRAPSSDENVNPVYSQIHVRVAYLFLYFVATYLHFDQLIVIDRRFDRIYRHRRHNIKIYLIKYRPNPSYYR